MLRELPERLHHPLRRPAHAGVGEQARVVERHHLAVVLRQARLVVERIDLADPALHEQEDDPLRRAGRSGVFGASGFPGEAAFAPGGQPREGEVAEPAAGALQQVASRDRSGHGLNSSARTGATRSVHVAEIDRREQGLEHHRPRLFRAHCRTRLATNRTASSRSARSWRTAERPADRRASTRAASSWSGPARSRRRGPSRLVEDERVVHQEQRLRRDRAHVAPADDHARVGEVEHLEQLGQGVAEDREVDAPPASGRPRSRSRRRGPRGIRGRPSSGRSVPLTERIVSRMHSASSRRRFCRQSRRFSGSTAAAFGSARPTAEAVGPRQDDPAHQRLHRPAVLATNRTARSSSSSGCDGGSPVVPKLSAVRTRPAPEEPVPGAVDEDAGGQRVVGRSPSQSASSRRPLSVGSASPARRRASPPGGSRAGRGSPRV